MSETGDRKPDRELASKQTIAIIATAGTILAAAVSGTVSYLVSTASLKSEDTRARADMFKQLVEQVQIAENPNYALLALWKIYPNDKKLIVITALQKPTVQSLTTLRALGYEEELRKYNETIKSIMVNATPEQRKDYSRLFLEVSAESVLDISLEAAIKLGNEIDEINRGPALEITGYLQRKPDLIPVLEKRIASDKRINRNDQLRVALALALYAAEARGTMNVILDEAGSSIQNFSRLSTQLTTREMIRTLTVSDREKLWHVAVANLEKVLRDNQKEHYFLAGVDVIEELRNNVVLSREQEAQIVDIYSKFYALLAKRGIYSKLVLRRLSKINPEISQKLYLATLACQDGQDVELFFKTFDTDDLDLGSGFADSFADAKREAISRMRNNDMNCGN